MLWQLDLAILSLVIICGVAAITVKDLLSAAVLFGAYSFLMCLLWAIMGAVDVAFTEASVGAGVSTVFFVAAYTNITKKIPPDNNIYIEYPCLSPRVDFSAINQNGTANTSEAENTIKFIQIRMFAIVGDISSLRSASFIAITMIIMPNVDALRR